LRWTFAFLTLMLVVAFAAAQGEPPYNVPSNIPERATLIGLSLIGRGIAVNPSDVMDFKVLRVGAGRVALPLRNLTNETTDSEDFEMRCINQTRRERCVPVIRVGVIFIDGERYLLKKIDVMNESVSAVLVKNNTEEGTIALVKVRKGMSDIWAGTLNISGMNYFAYILGTQHPLVELREAGRELKKKCGPMEPPVNASELTRCHQEGGRIVIERDENGCPLAPRCVKSTGCPPFAEPTQAQIDACKRRGGQMLGGVDERGCQLRKRCVMAGGETGEE